MTGPRPVLGTMTFGDTVDHDTAASMLDLVHDAGVTEIDTANAYAGGATEEMLGELLARRPGRFTVATKAGIAHPDAGGAPPLSPQALRACLEGSLRRLRLDHVDLFYLHQPDPATPLDDTVAEVATLAAKGLVGRVGVSNFAAWQIAELRRLFAAAGLPGPVVAQQLYSLVARRIDDEYVAFALASGIETMVYNPLGGGLLSGRYTFEAAPDEGRFATSRLSPMYRERYWDPRLFEAVGALSAVAADAGVSLPELALRWLASRPVVGSVLLGASKPAHLMANLEALARGPLPADAVERCDDVGRQLRGPMPAYNR
ncbi:aryl-alcohol dehydrogenase-like predicted oxidoreductase [Jiangella mangrovi]|uniref:Aryl-alcohol dehydrogenase-like predicted oxidoreductase n=2 Tax=Jiangella mangrovi TaxID=1524084 RepID=A0A7W9GUW5_9ACTN|nr:aryl-alcohol dehydrogenase-like predicted oxidoreductase [Jiangella mangrovi]